MANSSSKNAGSVVEQEVIINSKIMPYEHALDSIKITKLTNRIAKASLILNDGKISTNEYPLLESSDVVPGANIEIKAGFDGNKETIYKGVIISIKLQVGPQYSQTIIECADQAIALTRTNLSQVFTELKDSEAITRLANLVSTISVDIDSTDESFETLVQQNSSPWQFILSRARANSMLVWVDDNEFKVKKIKPASSPVLTTELGTNDALMFEGSINANEAFSDFTVNAWSSENQEISNAKQAAKSVDSLGNITASKLASALAIDSKVSQTDAQLTGDSLSNIAKSENALAQMRSITGKVTIKGDAKAKLGAAFELKGVSERFCGITTMTGVEHLLQSGSFTSTIRFGLDTNMLHSPAVYQASSSSLDIEQASIPRSKGISTGKVVKIDEDPQGNYRVKVRLLNSDPNSNKVWARLSSPYSSNEFGFFFFPEIDDEVLLGFVDDNPNEALIIGSVYSSKAPCDGQPDEKNTKKAISTRSSLKLEFNDEDVVTTLSTPSGNIIKLDEKEKSITLVDSFENEVLLHEDGISLTSPKSININAKKDVKISATGDVSVAGNSVDINGKTQLETKAPSVTSQADGNMTIKGAMVMIN